MAKEAVFQVRMDAEMKEQVEMLYQQMGSSFAEAVRMLAAQSLQEQGMPFKPTVRKGGASAYGIASAKADPTRRAMEEGAFSRAAVNKYVSD